MSADQHEPRTFEVTLAEGETKQLEVEPGVELPPPPPVAAPELATHETGGGGATMRTAAYIVSAVGIVGVGLGTVFGLQASAKWSSAQEACKPGACGAGSQARDDKAAASSAGNLSTVTFIIGGAALATGITLLVLAPSSSSGRPPGSSPTSAWVRLVPGLGGVSAIGRF